MDLHPSGRNLVKTKCVHRWVPKLAQSKRVGHGNSKKADFQETLVSNSPNSKSLLLASNPASSHGPTLSLDSSPSCTKFLGLGHTRKTCTQSIRCHQCFNYGHSARSCLNRLSPKRHSRPISRVEVGEASPGNKNPGRCSLLTPSTTVSPLRPPTSPTQNHPLCLLAPLPWRTGRATQCCMSPAYSSWSR